MCAAYSFKMFPQLLSFADPWELLIVIFGLDCLWEFRRFRAKDLTPDRRERIGDALPSLGMQGVNVLIPLSCVLCSEFRAFPVLYEIVFPLPMHEFSWLKNPG